MNEVKTRKEWSLSRVPHGHGRNCSILQSKDLGTLERIGCHSLPRRGGFHANACGMTDTGIDPEHGSLHRFEMTPGGHTWTFLLKGNTHEDGNQRRVVHAHGTA